MKRVFGALVALVFAAGLSACANTTVNVDLSKAQGEAQAVAVALNDAANAFAASDIPTADQKAAVAKAQDGLNAAVAAFAAVQNGSQSPQALAQNVANAVNTLVQGLPLPANVKAEASLAVAVLDAFAASLPSLAVHAA